jgi:hypothetical protein
MTQDEPKKVVVIKALATGHSVELPTAAGVVFQPIPDVDATLALVGRVAVVAAYVEGLLDRMIWNLLGVDHRLGSLQTNTLVGADQRLLRCLKLGRARPLADEVITRLEAAQVAAADLSEARARILHDPWFVDVASGRTAQFRAAPRKTPTVFGFVEVSPAEVEEVIERQRVLWAEVAALHDAIKVATAPTA